MKAYVPTTTFVQAQLHRMAQWATSKVYISFACSVTRPALPDVCCRSVQRSNTEANVVIGHGYQCGPTLAITWPQGALGEEDSLVEAAQVHGDVIRPPAASGFVLGCPSKP
jgi:hypothetical protein